MQLELTIPHKNFLIFLGKAKSLTENEKTLFLEQGFEIVENALAVSEPSRILALIAQPESSKEIAELKALKPHFQQSRILIIEDIHNPEVVQQLLHAELDLTFIASHRPSPDFYQKLQSINHELSLIDRQQQLRRSASQKYKDLIELNANLERLVDENTFHLKRSHQEEKLKLQQERDLVQFILEMQRAREREEALLQIRRELKSYKKVFEVMLFQEVGLKSVLIHFHNGQMLSEIWETPIANGFDHRNLVTSDQVNLARILSRPMNRILRIPLTRNHTSFGAQHTEIWLEVLGTEKEADETLLQTEEIFKVSKMAFDRIFQDETVALTSQRWLQIFDGLKEPVAIISDQFELIRSNSKFMKNGKSIHCYESFANRSSPCEGCPLVQAKVSGPTDTPVQIQSADRFYAVHSHAVGAHRYVHYYEDVTQSRTLYARLIQTEKLGALGALAGQVAHELNNPLSGIKSMSQILKSQMSESETIYKDLNEVEKATVRCQNIIHQLLEFSKDEGLEAIDCSLDEIVERTIPLLKTAMRSHRVQMRLDAKAQVLHVEPQLLQQVVFNLVQNACQAMAQAGTLQIVTRIDSNFVYFEVQDSGPGIPEDIKPRLFEAFFTTKPAGSGTGLGLYLSRKIVERFQGQLTFESNQQGTLFSARWPYKNQNRVTMNRGST